MMIDRIEVEAVAKRFANQWIFRNLSLEILPSVGYVILGANGSGKSTLLQILSSYLSPTKGKVNFWNQGKALLSEEVYRYISICTPYMELTEEFTLDEMLDFHLKFQNLVPGFTKERFIDYCYLSDAKDKQLRHFSSGMKQRVKLALALLSDTGAVFLDEPTSNLDRKAIEWYQQMVKLYSQNRIVVVCSNRIEEEYQFCQRQIVIEDYK
jgi:ABC-type multidrug transport system ATPase subunit